MKANHMSLIYVATLLGLFLGTGLLLVSPAQAQIKANIKFDPNLYDWSSPSPDWWIAVISLTGGYKADQINASTVLLESSIPADPTLSGVHTSKEYFYAYFDGTAVYNILWLKIYHMGIIEPNPHRPYRIHLTITGNLVKEAGALPFEGEGVIKVRFPFGPPPPPPPGP